jgi:hypothetical protein
MMNRNRFLSISLWWVLANTVAGAIAGALEAGGFQFVATFLLTGVLVGIAQWLLLRQYRYRVKWWAIATALGWIAGQYLNIAIRDALPLLYSQPFYAMIPTLVMAIAQTLAFPIRPWPMWLLISAAGGGVHALFASGLCAVVCQPIMGAFPGSFAAVLATAISYGAGWLGYGIVTAPVLRNPAYH